MGGFLSTFSRLFRLFLVLGMLCMHAMALAAQPASVTRVVTLSPETSGVSPAGEFLVWQGADPGASFAEARAALETQGVPWHAPGPPAPGYDSPVFWAKLNLRNQFADHQDWVLRIEPPREDQIDFYHQDADGNWLHKRAGTAHSFHARDLPHSSISFVFTALAGQNQTLYFRVQDSGLPKLPVTLYAMPAHLEQAAAAYFRDAFQYGALSVTALVLILVWSSARQPAFLWLGLFVAMTTLYALAHHGYTAQFFWPDYPAWDQRLMIANNHFAAAAGLMFASCTLYLRGRQKLLRLALRGGAVFALLVACTLWLTPTTLMMRASVIFTGGYLLLATLVSLLAFSRQPRPQRLMVVSWLVFLSGIGLQLLAAVFPSQIPASLLYHSNLSVVLIAITLLLVALIDFLRSFSRDKQQLQTELLETRNIAFQAERQTELAKDRFLHSVTHDFGAPLHSIVQLSQRLISEQADAPALSAQHPVHALNLIRSSAERMQQLLEQATELSVLQKQGEAALRLSCVDLKALCVSASAAARDQIHSKSLHVLETYPDDAVYVMADSARLEQVLMNLLSNAVKFTVMGYVMVDLSISDDTATVSIKDSGPGIPEHEHEHIFKRFYKLANSHSLMGPGLGLPICRQILRLHNTQITITSQAGEGATFSFTLPLYTPPTESVPAG